MIHIWHICCNIWAKQKEEYIWTYKFCTVYQQCLKAPLPISLDNVYSRRHPCNYWLCQELSTQPWAFAGQRRQHFEFSSAFAISSQHPLRIASNVSMQLQEAHIIHVTNNFHLTERIHLIHLFTSFMYFETDKHSIHGCLIFRFCWHMDYTSSSSWPNLCVVFFPARRIS